jgi:hypothetical protein
MQGEPEGLCLRSAKKVFKEETGALKVQKGAGKKQKHLENSEPKAIASEKPELAESLEESSSNSFGSPNEFASSESLDLNSNGTVAGSEIDLESEPPVKNMAENGFRNLGRGSKIQILEFHGKRDENFRNWIRKFEIVYESNNWPLSKKASTLAAHLSDRAFHEYVNMDEQVRTDYDSLKAGLDRIFGSSKSKR